MVASDFTFFMIILCQVYDGADVRGDRNTRRTGGTSLQSRCKNDGANNHLNLIICSGWRQGAEGLWQGAGSGPYRTTETPGQYHL
jgi:hypothetical protein